MCFSSHHGDIRVDTAIGGTEENRQNSRKACAGFTDAVAQGNLFRHFYAADFLASVTEDTSQDSQEGNGS